MSEEKSDEIKAHEERIRALKERIAKAQEARAPFEAEAERRAEAAALERKARLAEQASIDDPHIEAAREKYGDDAITVIDSDVGAFVVRAPNHLKWNALLSKGDKLSHVDLVGAVRSCLVYPDWARADKMLEQAPGALTVLVEAIGELANARSKARSGK